MVSNLYLKTNVQKKRSLGQKQGRIFPIAEIHDITING